MSKNKAVTVDYEELCRLFELDPDRFEQTRKELIEEEICQRPPEVQDRLRKFQWSLDMKRKKCKNALEACFMFHKMLMDSVYGENGLLRNLERLLEVAKGIKASHDPVSPTVETKILHFPMEQKNRRINCS